MRSYTPLVWVLLASAVAVSACSEPVTPPTATDSFPAPSAAPLEHGIDAVMFDPASRPYELKGSLIPAEVTMVSAWDIPKNPVTDLTLDDMAGGSQVRWGYRLFVNTPDEAPHLTPSAMSCGNCHLNAGQRELALPLLGSAAMFPEYNPRAGLDFTLEDRIVGCFMRSQNAPGGSGDGVLPETTSGEVQALAAYIRWLSEGFVAGANPPWRKQNVIPADARIPIDQLDPTRGEALYGEHCAECHGEDGQGVQIADKKAGPLWGPRSWNDGAGAARVYTLAGIIRYMMPYLDPGVLNDEEAQQIAAFITSKPRPAYPYKNQDYQTEPRPIDAVYYEP